MVKSTFEIIANIVEINTYDFELKSFYLQVIGSFYERASFRKRVSNIKSMSKIIKRPLATTLRFKMRNLFEFTLWSVLAK